jgi:tetratricopeptide (TPR) repeat protein
VPTRLARRSGQRPKGPIDPTIGERIRTLRTARKLSQSELAGPDFSAGFISLVETGRTRISLRAAEILARRLDLPVSELVGPAATTGMRELEFTALRAEQDLAAGRSQDALDSAEVSLRKARGILKVQLMRLKGRALLDLGRGREAIVALDAALRSARDEKRQDLVIRLLFDLARAHALADSTSEAIDLALEVERRLNERELVDRTLELQVVNFLANMLVVVGDFVAADLRAQRALALAEDTSDPRALADLYSGLAIARQEAGDLEAALLYSRKAIELFEQLGRERDIAATWNNLAWIYIKRNQLTRAEEAVKKASALAERARHERLQALVLATQAEIALARGHPAEAIDFADRVAGDKRASDWARANALWVKAQAVAAQKTSLAKLIAAFDEATRAFASQPRRWQAKVHESYAAVLAAREQHREANKEYALALELLRPGLR